MFQAYVDDSMAKDRVLVLGGLISRVERWEAFSDEWRERCRLARWPAFKMTEVWARRENSVVWENAKFHYFTIRDHVGGAVCMTVPLVPLAHAAQKYGFVGTPVANPYTWAFKGLISGLSKYQLEWGLDEPVDFIFDERGEEHQVREGWETFAATIPEAQRAILGRKPIFETDDRVLPLQAGDMWAWWCRKTWLDNGGKILADSFPIPWGTVGEIPQMILQWSAEEIDAELARVAADLKALAVSSGKPPA